MKNIDRIKQMDCSEITRIINGNKCNMCIYNNTNCMKEFCSRGIKEWLEQESELTIEEIADEFDKFCCDISYSTESCISCEYENETCRYDFLRDHFNMIDGKITRR